MKNYDEYLKILNTELVPAMGCTEPIAIAYAASLLKDVLGAAPEKIHVFVSRNIIKNVKSVIVPNTNKRFGIETAVAIGVIGGESKLELEVISRVTEKDVEKMDEYLKNTPILVSATDNEHTLYIEVVGTKGSDAAKVVISDSHTNVSLIELNGKVLVENKQYVPKAPQLDKSVLSVKGIVAFADTLKIQDVSTTISRQIRYNMAIAKEGIENDYGANVGKTILKYGQGVIPYCKALAASASDARMNGCELPVIINSGSGNQGISCSVPVVAYAEKKGFDEDKLYRALALSNLITIHVKNSIGKLSAFCGVVIAGAAAGCGIAYLEGGKEEEISHTLVNALAIISGTVCDGAKSSCAAKIASSVEAGILGYFMFKEGNQFLCGEGIVKKGVENTIKAIGDLARVGMCETDKEIVHIMVDKTE